MPTGPKQPTIKDQYPAMFAKMLESHAYMTPNKIMARRVKDAGNAWLKKNGHGGIVCRVAMTGENYAVHFDRSMEDI